MPAFACAGRRVGMPADIRDGHVEPDAASADPTSILTFMRSPSERSLTAL